MGRMKTRYRLLIFAIIVILLISATACGASVSSEKGAGGAPIVGACVVAEAVQPEIPGLAWGERAEGFDQLPAQHQTNWLLDKLNPELEYAAYSYALDAQNSIQDGQFSNLTGTSCKDEWPFLSAYGWRILTSAAELAEYDTILNSTETNAASVIVDRTGTTEASFDETFFEANRLLLVDLCELNTEQLLAYPLKPEVEDNTAKIQVRFDSADSIGTTSGRLLLIVIPAECSNAVVTLIPGVGFAA